MDECNIMDLLQQMLFSASQGIVLRNICSFTALFFKRFCNPVQVQSPVGFVYPGYIPPGYNGYNGYGGGGCGSCDGNGYLNGYGK